MKQGGDSSFFSNFLKVIMVQEDKESRSLWRIQVYLLKSDTHLS